MRRHLFLLLSIMLALVIGLGACSNNNAEEENESKEETFNPEPNPDTTQVSSYNDERMEEQAEMDAELLAEYEKDDYTVMNPFVKLDPRSEERRVGKESRSKLATWWCTIK